VSVDRLTSKPFAVLIAGGCVSDWSRCQRFGTWRAIESACGCLRWVRSSCAGRWVYAAGEATDFRLKYGVVAARQPDSAAQANRGAGRGAHRSPAVRAGGPRDSPELAAKTSPRASRRRQRLQLGVDRGALVGAAGEDRRAVPRAKPGLARLRRDRVAASGPDHPARSGAQPRACDASVAALIRPHRGELRERYAGRRSSRRECESSAPWVPAPTTRARARPAGARRLGSSPRR
jgi:hypothetical protein